MTSSPAPALHRRLGLLDAVVIGLGSMIGAGIFASFAPAAAAASSGLIVGLAIAGVIAYCNATSSAQLAAQYPVSGGSYVYGRERLGHWPGFIAGWSFVIGKTASCAAMALTFAAYTVPEGWQKPVAVAAVAALAAVNYFGVTRTAGLTRLIVSVVLVVLVVVVAAGLAGISGRPAGVSLELGDAGWYGTLQSAGLLFFAFAGYARVATMGEEVTDPAKTIPRAVLIALSAVLVIYAVIALIALTVLGPERLAGSTAPLVDLVLVSGWDWAAPVVRIGAAAAALGALLALIAGVGRTGLAMARNGDLPRWLASVHPKYAVPHRAEVSIAVIVSVLVLSIDLRGALGFSSFGVLLYYFVTNLASITQVGRYRRFPRVLAVVGGIGCLVLVVTLPTAAIAVGLGVLVVGVLYRLARMRFERRSHEGRRGSLSP